ncbi:hypothetical protein AVEN_113344-1 [Araneus ventricosus]|uniref:Tc1-like transposase DDE domain-containing protein n=1 Tax=Araneus ventricosus TaxID=182803 RepID=A0A4Y2KKQ5_ARAVE|nr:hypothetical protein AVEN_113344-1 [Araneus ventricosus]
MQRNVDRAIRGWLTDNTSLDGGCLGETEMECNWLKDPVCQQGTVQSGGAALMVWDVCSWRDMGPLIRLETTLTGDRYLSILSDHLLSFMCIVHSDGLGQFQQDNATPHVSRVATKWLQKHSSDFRHTHWPPKSSEMNIIEDILDALLHAVEKDLHHLALLWIC